MLEGPTGESTAVPTTIPHWYDPDSDALAITDGDGTTVVDETGTTYLDFVSQLYCVNAGHGNRTIIDGMTEQLEQIQYVSAAKRSPVRAALGERLVDLAPASLSHALFSVTGSEANELAVQLARNHTGASKVLTRWRSYHGSTYGAGSLTGDPETRNLVETHAATTGAAKFLPPMAHRSPFDAETPAELADAAADHLEFVIRNEGPDSIAAIMMEPVAGSSGAYTAPSGYFERVRELCDEYEILLIADEVITGFGRCGEWFGIETEGVEPDLLTFAKGVTSSYAPLAGVLARPELVADIEQEGFDLGQTFGGHPVSCAAGLAAIEAYDNGLIENARENAPALETGLAELASRTDVVADVRGRGYLRAVEFADPATGEPFYDPRVDDTDGDENADEPENPVPAVAAALEDRGVIVGTGRPATQLLLAPPLCATATEIETALTELEAAIDEVF
ncbi:aminotransferase family protein [Natrialba asiatica]|uniref:Class III aminotransferase n=1 Tax=Natrialba asiatica (strain ATCC 700177 / DSM 12278 / JCM 9576 / FERM P-10747 / NBRC 102637 / 172P1) TaxID=29540 RepID=M0AMB8_NATA1|nr:aminotransferase class III-fold pyridoxal phosphate-dependent enzyme [Natrialba asiatica]ELY99486.1 class III aminotransferase [Natrialba asiatica DSM 12278]